jgi:hypothetical protein
MHIQAIASNKPIFSIEAALQHPEVRGVARILAKAGIAKPTSKFKAFELGTSLADAGLSAEERMRCKLPLDHAGLIDWAA